MLRGDLTLWTTIQATALTEVQGDIFAEPDTDEILLPAVRTAYSFHAGRKRTWTRTIDLSSLETLTRGGIGIANTKQLTTLSFPSLRSISGSFGLSGGVGDTTTQVVEAPLLESIDGFLAISLEENLTFIDFSSLTYLDPDRSLEIFGDPMLPSCYATDIRDRLNANGWNGTVYINGLDENGTCSP
jgi:hypothetical protein